MKKILLALCLALTALSAWAVKADPTPVVVIQPDGTKLTICQHGDEHFSWLTTTDGVLLSQVGNAFYVAHISESGELTATRQIAHNPNLRSASETMIVRAQDKGAFFSAATQAIRMIRKAQSIGSTSPAYFPHTGSPKVLVILTQFSDSTFAAADPVKSFNDYFNHKGKLPDYTLNEKRNYGSVKQYFHDMSNGMFTPQFDIVGPITLPKPGSYYGQDEGYRKDTKITELIHDACNAVSGTVNFDEYDSNNDGNIDLVYILYAGYSQSSAPHLKDLIWPKAGTLYPFKVGNKNVSRYGVSNELNYYPGYELSAAPYKRINGIGLFCHEFSHTMGLPDFYPYAASAQKDDQAMEIWDLMDGGEYTDNGYTPTPYTPWEKEVMGWSSLQTIGSEPAKITLQADQALKLPTDNEKEYLILHNIQKEGWASKLATLGHGMLIYRVNYTPASVNMWDHVNDVLGKPGMTIVPADGKLISSYTIDSSDPAQKAAYYASYGGDPFPGTSHIDHLGSIQLNLGTLNKPLYHIAENPADGTITFEYLQDITAGIRDAVFRHAPAGKRIYSLDGRYVGTDHSLLPKGIYVRDGHKFVK